MTPDPQSGFAAAVLDPDCRAPAGLFGPTGQPAGRRFDVYRNNVTVSLIDALITGFPVLTRLLGDENMRGLGRAYARAHPPRSPVMTAFGDELPEFLAQAPQLTHLPYLADVARLELALRRAYHAADAVPIADSALAECSPDELMKARLGLAPAFGLLRSPWPIYGLWQYNTHPDAPKPEPGAEDVMILRPEFDPYPAPLPAGGAVWITALQSGQPLGRANDIAEAETPEFDLSACLAPLLAGGAIVSITIEKDADQ